MKKKSADRSGFFNAPVLISFAFCSIGVFLALVVFALYPGGNVLASARPLPVNGDGNFASRSVTVAASFTFDGTGSLNAARDGYTATLPPDGKALVAGGVGDTGFLGNAEQYDVGLGALYARWTINTPTLGNYPATSVALSANAAVMPDAAPTDTTSINVSTSTSFQGTFVADSTTGIVLVTDAHPAGTYTVTVTAFSPGGTATKTFTLTVTDRYCLRDRFH